MKQSNLSFFGNGMESLLHHFIIPCADTVHAGNKNIASEFETQTNTVLYLFKRITFRDFTSIKHFDFIPSVANISGIF